MTPLALFAILLICAAFGVGVLTEPRDEAYAWTCDGCSGSWSDHKAARDHVCDCEATR